MTLIVGIKCSDGVVLGADGAATLGPLGRPTVVQQVAKLHIIENRIIMAVSGPVGLGQLYVDRVQALWSTKKLLGTHTAAEVMRALRDAVLQDAMVAIQGAAASAPFLGGVASVGALTGSLVALSVHGKPELIELDHQATPEMKTDDLPHVAIGSGQSIADPFMAFLRRVFWNESLPNVAMGTFATVWTLRHAISVNPGGLSNPISIAALRFKDQELTARVLEPQDLEEAEEDVREAEDYLKRFRDPQQPLGSTPPPNPPSAP